MSKRQQLLINSQSIRFQNNSNFCYKAVEALNPSLTYILVKSIVFMQLQLKDKNIFVAQTCSVNTTHQQIH